MVSTSELKLMMTKMGTNMTDQELSDIIKESGASAKGISYPEFCKLMRVGGGRRRTRLSARDLEDQGEQEEDLRHAFSLFDRNRDGEIDAAEMTAAAAHSLSSSSGPRFMRARPSAPSENFLKTATRFMAIACVAADAAGMRDVVPAACGPLPPGLVAQLHPWAPDPCDTDSHTVCAAAGYTRVRYTVLNGTRLARVHAPTRHRAGG